MAETQTAVVTTMQFWRLRLAEFPSHLSSSKDKTEKFSFTPLAHWTHKVKLSTEETPFGYNIIRDGW